MRLRYTVTGLGEVEHDMLGMATRALEPGPVLGLIGKAMQRIEKEVFATEGRGSWPPLAAATIAAKGNDKILIETSALLNSLTSESAEGALFEVNGNELLFGTNLTSEDGAPYPAFLQAGTSRMPARDPLPGPNATDLREFSRAIQTWIVGADREEFGTQPWGLGSLDPFGL